MRGGEVCAKGAHPGEFEGDEVLGQLAERWQNWRQRSQRLLFCDWDCWSDRLADLARHWFLHGGPRRAGVVRRFGKSRKQPGRACVYVSYPFERVEVSTSQL